MHPLHQNSVTQPRIDRQILYIHWITKPEQFMLHEKGSFQVNPHMRLDRERPERPDDPPERNDFEFHRARLFWLHFHGIKMEASLLKREALPRCDLRTPFPWPLHWQHHYRVLGSEVSPAISNSESDSLSCTTAFSFAAFRFMSDGPAAILLSRDSTLRACNFVG